MSRSYLTAAFLVLAVFVSTTDCENKGTKLKGKSDKLVARGLCESNEFQCSVYGTCIPLDRVCDTNRDCNGGQDEVDCPTNCTGHNQFKCANSNKCIGIADVCDGQADCTDYSDEASCANVHCVAGKFKCNVSKECVRDDYVCDRLLDCQDGTDEKNCHYDFCISYQWECADKQSCISRYFVCDGDYDCADHSDEKDCNCVRKEFKCAYGGCIPGDRKCDGHNDCGDKSDEIDCPALPKDVCADVLTFEDCFYMNETTHPICTIHVDADKFCRKFCEICKVTLTEKYRD